MTKATMMTAMMMLILGPECLRRPWGAHKGQHDVSNPQMRERSTDMIFIIMMMVVRDDTNYLNRTILFGNIRNNSKWASGLMRE